MTTKPRGDMDQWYASIIASVISSSDTQQIARQEAQRLVGPGGLAPEAADFAAARAYLRKCLQNMSPEELSGLTFGEAGALLARGALGAAEYRRRLGGQHRDESFRRRRRRFGARGPREARDDDDD